MAAKTLPIIDLTELAVPFQGAVTLRVGRPISPDTLIIARQRFLDHLVIESESAVPLGFIPTRALEDAFTRPDPWTTCMQSVMRHTLPARLPIDKLLHAFVGQQISSVHDQNPQHPIGFVTFSDLNKHPVRSAMYPLFAGLESHLATLIERRHVDPWNWILHLDRDKQARIVGYWELSRRQGVDIGPIAGTTLTELLNIVRKDGTLRTALGFNSGGKWDSVAHGISELRNLVMHPVRPMFSSQDDLNQTLQRLQDLAHLVELSHRLIQSPPTELQPDS